ncbi:SusC/RagA family TonB-linked outer membrane protein [Dyadobacter subterraneus]|uniref:SusC/RagA family TonB-linked outer membrane protein n=1 Tax=Dyadobacter subterraneus TaxID=2773304 RepID=A0ABR9WL29_9BACT|nr:SusC/RagA family TonB-linked outer membrane protein [Dyadobacter subterraneus]MBE9466105.1 SusC/RagA family TonB-linked outer membrane protein [Dyadobacter subterraneus]
MKRKQEVKCPLWMKLTFYQIVVFSASIGGSFAAPVKSGGVLNFTNTSRVNVRAVTGTVKDNKGEALPGSTVVIKGSEKGTITDADGKFSIDIPNDQVILIVSSIGFTSKEIAVGSQSVLDVVLETSAAVLEEVVVTALGIKRDKKALTYAAQQIGGQELRVAANNNFVDALNGKAAGIDIKVSSSGPGGSTRAVLRGNKSLQGSSEALYVIDGIPMVNNKGGQPGSYGGNDGGDGLSAINPNDIESISVLRGANAAILYGSQGANGVILITTKKGKEGKVSVDFNSSAVFDQVSGLPKFQYRYGSVGGDYSWTPTGTAVVKSDNYQKDYIKDFFRIGSTLTNSVAVTSGNAKSNVYFSYANISASGIMPTNTYRKNNFSFRQSTKLLKDKMTLSSGIILSNEVTKNRPGAGYYNNPLTGLYLFARDRDFNNYKENYAVFDPTRNMDKMNWYSTEEKQNNPYWELNKDPKLQTSKRIIANAKLSYEITHDLKFEIRGNIDYNNVLSDKRYAAAGNSVSVSPNGSWDYAKYNDQSIYTDGILSYNKTFGDFSLNALAGLSYQKNKYYDGITVANGTVSLQYPNVFTFANIPYNVSFNNDSRYSNTIKQGAFGNVSLGFKEFLFLDIAARNDWASTLALTGNQSYLYPSFGGSAIFSQMFTLPEVISFLKARASFTHTANEVPYNVVNPYNSIGGAGGPSGIGGINRNTQVPFTNLKPEKIVANEYGIEAKFFKNRVGLDFTLYNGTSTNQFLSLDAPSGSGYTTYYVNAGKITNHGFETTLTVEPIRAERFSWTSTINASQNKNKIVELIASNPTYQVGGDDEGFASIIKAGGSFNDVYIYKFARNDAGQIILDANGVPTKAALQTKVGNVNPKLLMGWNNSLRYRNFFANILVNGKFGGVAFSKTEAFLDSYGVSERSAEARDAGTVAINAVKPEGTAVTSIDPYTYYSAIGDRNKIMEPYIFKRTNVRLGQFVFGYNFKTKSSNPVFRDASISIVGRNLFFFYKKAPFDPEQAMSTNNSLQSTDVFGLPSTRSYGVNLKFTF